MRTRKYIIGPVRSITSDLTPLKLMMNSLTLMKMASGLSKRQSPILLSWLDYSHPNDQTRRTTETAGFKTFVMIFCALFVHLQELEMLLSLPFDQRSGFSACSDNFWTQVLFIKKQNVIQAIHFILFRLNRSLHVYGSYWHNSQSNRILTRLVWPLEIPRQWKSSLQSRDWPCRLSIIFK